MSLSLEPASPPPSVELTNAFAEPYNNAVATARTCYSSRIVKAADVARDERARAKRDEIAQGTYAAGHHTTLQHATFQFAITRVSRQLVWSFLHAHPFYNSEQTSQRYVEVAHDQVIVPELPAAAAAIYRETVAEQMRCYHELGERLKEPVAAAYFELFPARRAHRDRYESELKKRAQEAARYALPIGTFTNLYHTINGLVLHRYHRLSRMLDVPDETRLLIDAMVSAVTRHDPLFTRDMEDPIPLEHTCEYALLARLEPSRSAGEAREFRRAFDAKLEGRTSRLIGYDARAEALLAEALRMTVGTTAVTLPDEEAIAWALSPAQNPALGETLNLTCHTKLTRVMAHPHYTFQKKLSHAADSQDQRHRLTPASRPLLATHYVGGEPDVVAPRLFSRSPAAEELFMATMRRTWQAIDALLDMGIAPTHALYLLPNAFPIRFLESGDLGAWRHKWTTRLCCNAQEEIWYASRDEVAELLQVHPRIAAHLGPPCLMRHRAKISPRCPEGKRFCGVPLWKRDLFEFDRVL